MGQLVEIVGVQHNPLLYRRFQRAAEHPAYQRARDGYEQMRERLAAARPDVLLVVANDHLNQWFMGNMSPFLIGKAPLAQGPFPHESEEFGLPSYRAPGAVDVARDLLAGGYERGVDLAYSEEYLLDHAFMLPLHFIRPEADLPIVPLFANVMAPPIPPARRFYKVGEALRAAVEALRGNVRVGVVASGHLSVEIGGPRVMRSAPDLKFDQQLVDLVGRGDVDGLLSLATPERMLRAGNFTAACLIFVLLAGLARGQPATRADCVLLDTSTTPFFRWDLDPAVAR
jgi:protocatechuate 4,5-dioxygenase, beta chain